MNDATATAETATTMLRDLRQAAAMEQNARAMELAWDGTIVPTANRALSNDDLRQTFQQTFLPTPHGRMTLVALLTMLGWHRADCTEPYNRAGHNAAAKIAYLCGITNTRDRLALWLESEAPRAWGAEEALRKAAPELPPEDRKVGPIEAFGAYVAENGSDFTPAFRQKYADIFRAAQETLCLTPHGRKTLASILAMLHWNDPELLTEREMRYRETAEMILDLVGITVDVPCLQGWIERNYMHIYQEEEADRAKRNAGTHPSLYPVAMVTAPGGASGAGEGTR